MGIIKIIEHKDVAKYIISRGLLKQYKKAKSYLLAGNTEIINFKVRQPKEKGYYQFKINKQYRAFAYFTTDEILKVFKISDHQDF